jgi:hypothetical protein
MSHELIITFDFETPPPAGELGELFSALARDYRDMTKGRVLVVASLETGSLIAALKDYALLALPHAKDAVEVAKGIKAVADLAKLLKDWLDRAKSGKAKKQLYRRGRKTPGQRSVEAIVKIAASTGSAVRVKHTTAKGETIEVEMTPLQAKNARHEALAEQPLQIGTEGAPRQLKGAIPDMRRAIDRLYDPNLAELTSSEPEAVIDALVAVLQAAKLSYLADQIADDLANRGMLALSEALRAKMIHASDGKREPPLTTT